MILGYKFILSLFADVYIFCNILIQLFKTIEILFLISIVIVFQIFIQKSKWKVRLEYCPPSYLFKNSSFLLIKDLFNYKNIQ